MSRSLGSKAQTELSSLIAVFAVCAGLALYAGQISATLPPPDDPRTADVVADRVADSARTHGVVVPSSLDARRAGPAGGRLNVSLRAGDRRWTAGPPPPDRARTATKPVGVRVRPGTVRGGVLRVAIWR